VVRGQEGRGTAQLRRRAACGRGRAGADAARHDDALDECEDAVEDESERDDEDRGAEDLRGVAQLDALDDVEAEAAEPT
jgi:hypothetical protein